MEYLGQFVTVMSCSKCNVACKHCYISYKDNFTAEELKEITLNLGKKYGVMINGAEPLVDLKYLESYPGIQQERILTNGLVLIKEYNKVTEELRKHGINSISISYHFDIHDIISKVDKKDLELLFRKLNLDKFNTRVMTTITADNYRNIEEYCRRAYEMGANAIRFTNFVHQGSAQQMDRRLILTEEQRKEFFYQINNVREKFDKDKFYIQRCGTFGKDPTREDKNYRCIAGKDLVVITPDKMVYPCVFLARKGNEIGRYENGKIELFKELENNGEECIACKICNGER